MIQVSRQVDYAVRAIYYLAKLGVDKRASTKKIAKEQHIPVSFLAKIISQLTISGLVYTMRGARGGVSLARHPQDISLLDVVEAIDGPIQLIGCDDETSDNIFGNINPIRQVLCAALKEVVDRLGLTNFAEFLR